MGDASFVRTSFQGGEWSKLMQGRSDRPDYVAALNVCLNGLPIETGAWVRRPGFHDARETRGGRPGRVITFTFEAAQPYTIELTDGFMRFRAGRDLVITNDSVGVTSINTDNPALVTTVSATTWAAKDEIFFSLLDTGDPVLQRRVFSILAKPAGNQINLADSITGANVAGALTLPPGLTPVVSRVLNIATPYTNGSWASLRSVQTEKTAFLLNPSYQPYALTVTAEPSGNMYATFALAAASFIDGPYLDPFVNGVQANPSALTGIITVSLSFAAYDAARAYPLGAFVTSAGVNYISLVDQNVGNVPAASPTKWSPTAASEAIRPGGFDATDIGRQVRLLSEPAEWAAATAYSAGDIVAYNPSGVHGAATYWTALAGTTGDIPGNDTTNWQLTPANAALWTWGRITSIQNTITGGTNFGNLTEGGGVAAAFDGSLSKAAAACAEFTQAITTASRFVGKTVGGGKSIQQATIYPSSDFGFASNSAGVGLGTLTSITINLRASNSAPASSSDGTLLNTTILPDNPTTPVTLQASDHSVYTHFWFEQVVTWSTADPSNTVIVCQAIFFEVPSSSTAANAFQMEVLGPALLYTTAIRTWRLGVYKQNQWPTCGTYSDGRLWLSGAVANRIDSCMSNGISGTTVNFAPTDQNGVVSAASAITATFNAEDSNPVLWMVSEQQGIACGTKGGEWMVLAPAAGAITPFNISARRVTKVGCANIEPTRCEHTTLFVQKFGRKIMEFFPDVYSGKFTAPHITYTAKHLTLSGISEIAYQQELAPLVWARLADGTLIGCTYKRDTLQTSQGPTMAGWHRHVIGTGRVIESIAVGSNLGGNSDALTVVTKDTATGIRRVEVMGDILDEGSQMGQANYLDGAMAPTSVSGIEPNGTYPNGALTLNGLWTLNGKTVTAWLCGLDCGEFLVTQTGQITVPYGDGLTLTGPGLFTQALVDTGLPMLVGFTYDSQGQIVRPVAREDSGARSGPAFGKRRRYNQIAAQLVGAQGVSFGTDFGAMLPAAFKDERGRKFPINQQFNGIFRDAITSNDDLDGMLCWQISRPYICGIAAIGGFIETKDS